MQDLMNGLTAFERFTVFTLVCYFSLVVVIQLIFHLLHSSQAIEIERETRNCSRFILRCICDL